MIAFCILIIWTVFSYEISRKKSRKDQNKIYCRLMFKAAVFLKGLGSIYIDGVDTSLVYVTEGARAQAKHSAIYQMCLVKM